MLSDPYRPPEDVDGPVLPWWMDNQRASLVVAMTVIAIIFMACIDWNTLFSYDGVDELVRPDN